MSALPVERGVTDCSRRTGRGMSCVQSFAARLNLPGDFCPGCTQRLMTALEQLGEPLDWHPVFRARAAEPVLALSLGDRVEWNPADDVWMPATVAQEAKSKGHLYIRLDSNNQKMLVDVRHLRRSGGAS